MIIALIVIGDLLLTFLIPHLFVIGKIYHRFFGRYNSKNIEKVFYRNKTYEGYWDLYKSSTEELKNRGFEEINIKSFDGLNLFGRYFDNNSDKLIIFIHGVHATAFTNFAIHAKKALENGYNVLLVDQRGHGKSEGKHITYGKYEHKDILSWIDYVDKNKNINSIYLYGI